MTKPVRVVFVLPAMAGGGAERVVVHLLRHLDRAAFAPSLVLLDRSGVLLSQIPADVPVADCGRRGLHRGIDWLKVLSRKLAEAQPALVVSFLWFTNLAAIVARRRSGVGAPLIVCERLSLDMPEESFAARLVRRAGTRALHRFADRVTANSEAIARQLEHAAGLAKGSVVAIPNPVDLTRMRELAGAGDATVGDLATWPRPLIVGMGRLHRQKGFDTLISAFAASRSEGTVVLMGEGPERDALRAIVDRAGLASRVAFPGFLANPYTVLSRADLFVLSSRYEGFPNALVEAMALGRACIATRCPTGPEEIITDGSDGVLVPVGDEKAMADAIARLARDSAERERLGAAARESVTRYEAGAIVRRFETLFCETIQRRRG